MSPITDRCWLYKKFTHSLRYYPMSDINGVAHRVCAGAARGGHFSQESVSLAAEKLVKIFLAKPLSLKLLENKRESRHEGLVKAGKEHHQNVLRKKYNARRNAKRAEASRKKKIMQHLTTS